MYSQGSNTVAFLQQVPLFAELTADELHDLVTVMQPIELEPGQLLWRQGQAADALHLIRGGRIGIYLRQPGGTEVHLTTLGPGEVLGELPLIDGGTRSAAARALDRSRLWSLSRVDFAALTLRRSPSALALRRRICAVACTRLRGRYQQLANSLPPGLPPGASEPPTAAQLTKSAPPDDYLSSLAFFRDFAADHLRSLVEGSQLFMIPRRRVLEHEGDAPRGCYVTLNGAVEMTIERGQHRIPIGLAGPGRAFSYVGLIDGKTALARPQFARRQQRLSRVRRRSMRRSPSALQHPTRASNGADPQTGGPAKVIGGRTIGADTARPAVDWHCVLRVIGIGRCDSTVPGRGTGVSHPADTSCVGFPTLPPSSAHCRGRE